MSVPAAKPTLRFRSESTTDKGAIVALVESAYRGDASRQGWTTEADMLDGQRTDPVTVPDLLSKPRCTVLPAE